MQDNQNSSFEKPKVGSIFQKCFVVANKVYSSHVVVANKMILSHTHDFKNEVFLKVAYHPITSAKKGLLPCGQFFRVGISGIKEDLIHFFRKQ